VRSFPNHDLEHSRDLLLAHDAGYRLNSDADFFYPDLHVKIDNTSLEPAVVAAEIMERFSISLL